MLPLCDLIVDTSGILELRDLDSGTNTPVSIALQIMSTTIIAIPFSVFVHFLPTHRLTSLKFRPFST